MFEIWGNATTTPAGVTSFTLTKISANQTNIDWVKSVDAIGVDLVRSYSDFPVSPTDYYLLYHGIANSYEDKGLFPFSDKYYAIWEYNYAGSSSGYSRGKIEGDIMDVNFTLDTTTMIMVVAFMLLFVSIFIKRWPVYLAMAIAWIATLFDTNFNSNPYLIGVSVVVIGFALISLYRNRGSEGV
jgi:hypothetical protein